MSITSKAFWKELKSLGVQPTDTLLLALSGGVDSVALFHLLRAARISFAAAHVNYGLRGEDSDADEHFCRELCREHGITLYVSDAKQDMQERELSLQEAARAHRYAFFFTLMQAHRFDHMLTAHHADDSVETFFVNALRGSGSHGLGGIPRRNGKIIRPLLPFGKEEIMAYVKEHALPYRNDLSNVKDDYMRNRIRHHVVPALKQAEPTAVNRLRETMQKLSAEAELLQVLLHEKFPSSPNETPIDTILGFPEPLRATVVFKRFRSIGLNFSQAEDIAGALRGIPGKRFHTPTHRLLLDRGYIVVEELGLTGGNTVNIPGPDGHIPGYRMSVVAKDDVRPVKDGSCAFLDLDTLVFPLSWRPIETGDTMVPMGMRGRKKISDILIDTKKTRFEKEKLHVLCGGGEIVWLEGFRVSDSSKITDQTSRVLCIIPEKLQP